MRWLDAYRHQLSEEAAGRSNRFAKVVRVFRAIWIVASVSGIVIAVLLIAGDINAEGDGGGWSIIFGPVIAIVFTFAGAVPYVLAQLFLSVRQGEGAHSNG